MSREHRMDVGPVEISVDETQTADGTVTLGPLSLYLELDGYGHLTAEQARELIPWLVRAADKLDEITTGVVAEDNSDEHFDPLSDNALARLGTMVLLEQERRAKVAAIFAALDAEAKLPD